MEKDVDWRRIERDCGTVVAKEGLGGDVRGEMGWEIALFAALRGLR